MSVHYEHRSGQSKKERSYPVPSIFDIIICGFTPSVRMFIGQGLSLEARRAAQAERRSADTAKAPTSVAAAAAAASTAAAAANERASSASPPLFALSPTAEMDSIASLPTTDGIPSVVGAAKPGDDSSVTTADGDKHGNSQKMKDLSTAIIEYGKKMVSVAKMKCNQQEKDCNE
jgi:hypothetical protein